MVLSCPGWFSSLWLVSMEFRNNCLLKMSWGEKLPRNASSTHRGKTVMNKMFQETLGRQLIGAEEKEKMRQNLLKRLNETSSEEPDLQDSNKHLMLKWHRLLQIALLWMKILTQVLPYIQDMTNRLNDEHIPPFLEALQWPNTLKRKFKRNTEKMPFVIT
jgi:hypothetical protein